MRAFKTGMGVALTLLAVTGCGQAEREPRETQTSVRALQGAPDFVVAAVTGPASAQSGQSFTAQVTVCNRGTVSASTDVELYLSDDALIRPNTATNSEDKLVTGAPVPTLVPEQCVTLSLSGLASPKSPVSSLGDNGFYLGAVVDPRNTRAELLETNNALAGKRMGVGSKPDFTVTSVTGPVSVRPGQTFTAQVTVCNPGTQQSTSSEVELYLSADAIIRPNTSTNSEDRLITRAPVPALAPGQCTPLTLSGPASPPSSSPPPVDQGYYLGAVVDPRNTRPELLEDNNATAGRRMGVGSRADFLVTAITGETNVPSGQSFTAQVTVCNQGTVSDSTDVALYLSADATIRPNTSTSSEDRLVTSAPVPTLAPGQCTPLSLSGPASPPASSMPGGDRGYYLGAVVDPSNSRFELLEDNNATTGRRMGVGTGADFVVTAVTGPASVLEGQGFTAQVTVCNRGTQGDSTEVELFLSADTTLRPSSASAPSEDFLVTQASVPPLAPSQCATLPLSGPAYAPGSSPPGGDSGYYLGAVVDPRNTRAELLEDNNTFAGRRMGVGNKPDFVITAVTGPASVPEGQGFTAQVTVCNQGTQSASTEVELYLSADATIRANTSSTAAEDALVTFASVPTLVSGQCTTLPLSGQATVPPGSSGSAFESAYYLGAVVDPRNTRAELLEDNNATAGKRMGVGSRPDFVVTAVTGPTDVSQGQTFTAQVTVCNQGTVGDSTDVTLYLSADTTVRPDGSVSPPEDYKVTWASLPVLAPGRCITLPLSGQAEYPSTRLPTGDSGYYLGAIVDADNAHAELLEDNNTFAGQRMGVGSGADFVVTALSGPASVRPGQSFTTRATVCNQGTVSDSTDVELYLSVDTTPRAHTASAPSEDFLVAGAPVPTLAAGQCATVWLTGSASPPVPSTPGGDAGYYLGAVVDPRNGRLELLEDNNTFLGKRVGVGGAADFVVTALTGPASVRPGQGFTAQVTVCNQGTQSDSADVELYLSADTTLRPPPFSEPSEDVLVTGTSVPTLQPGQCTTLPLSGSAFPPAPSPPSRDSGYYLGAVVDPRNGRLELLEDNNTFLGKRMGVGNRPDFIVTAVSGPASVTYGQTFTAQVTVCNQGTESDSTDVTLLLSADTTLSPGSPMGPSEDVAVTWASVPSLVPGQCTTLPLSGPAYPPAQSGPTADSAFYLGAVVNPPGGRLELLEDNNAFVGKRMGLGNAVDFIVTALTGPASVRPGQTFTAQVTVCNQGTESGSTDVALFLLSNAAFPPPGSVTPREVSSVTWASVPTLVAGQCTTLPLSGPASPPEAGSSFPDQGYYLGTMVDPSRSRYELIEDNNLTVGGRMGVGSAADFVVTALSGPASVSSGQTFTAQATVCNQGTESDSTEVELYLSADTTLRPDTQMAPPEDFPVTRMSVPVLAPGQCLTLSLSGPAYAPAGPRTADNGYYLGTLVDPRNYRPELRKDNNATLGNVLVIR